jgi:putative ABC transport system permease protein
VLKTLRRVIRTLSRNRLLAAIAVATLALGIGSTSSVFSVVSAVLLRPFGYGAPEQLVALWQSRPAGGAKEVPVSAANYRDWRDSSRAFAGLAAYHSTPFNLSGPQGPERLVGMATTPNLFTVLAAAAVVGRTYTAADGDSLLVVLSYPLWQRRFGRDPGILGRSLVLDGQVNQVVGVMPAGFTFGDQAELWVVRPFTKTEMLERGNVFLEVVGRLKPGVTLGEAQQEMSRLGQTLAEQYPDVDGGFTVRVVPFAEQLVGDVRGLLLVLLAAVGCVLLVACANVANLLLARATERIREMAVRASLGAGRAALLRQSIGEGFVLSLAGGLCGLVLTVWGIRLLIGLPASLPRLREAAIDWRVATFTLALCLLTGLFFGLVPALQTSNARLPDLLKEGAGQASAAPLRSRLRSLLAVFEIAVALALLVVAGLLIESFERLRRVDPGFEPQRALTAVIVLPEEQYRTNPQRVVFFEQLVERVRALPGVQFVGAVSTAPMTGALIKEIIAIPGRILLPTEEAVNLDVVTPDYFRAMGIRLVKGRFLNAGDRAGSQPVAIVDEEMAKHYWGGDALHQRVALPALLRQPAEIVGVVASVRRFGLDREPQPQLYVSLGESADRRMDLVVRTRAPPESLTAAVRRVTRAVDPQLPVENLRPLAALVADSIAQQRFNAHLMVSFAVLALLLAMAGIYGVLSYTVAQRTREMGIRMALGGRRSAVLRLVLRQGMELVAAGLGLGLVLAFTVIRLMESVFFGLHSVDPRVVVGVSLLMAGVALLACFFPARRATRVDPMVALRHD